MINKICFSGNSFIDIIPYGKKGKYVKYLTESGLINRGDIFKVDIECKECKKEINVTMKNSYLTKEYLCNSCNKKGEKNPFFGKKHLEESKSRIGGSVHDYSGEKNPMFGKKIYDIWVSRSGKTNADFYLDSYKNKMSISNSGSKNGFFGKKHSKETREKLSNSIKKYFNINGTEQCKKAGISSIIKQSKGRMTSIEREVQSYLNLKNIKNKYSFILQKKYQYDFIIQDSNIIIEVQGDYWHGNPEIYHESKLSERQKFKKNQDKLKKKFAEDNGYKIFYIWEKDIKNKNFDSLKEIK